jgi:hypothetical protein
LSWQTPETYHSADLRRGTATSTSTTSGTTSHPGSLPPGLEPGATTLGGYDTITCKLETPSSLGGQQFIGDWVSDFGTQFDQNTGPADFRVAPNGLSYHAVAWYPNG